MNAFQAKGLSSKDEFLEAVKEDKELKQEGNLMTKINEEEDAEKKAVVSSLMIKCGKPTNEEVLETYDDFHLQHKDGSIQNEEYISSAPITV